MFKQNAKVVSQLDADGYLLGPTWADSYGNELLLPAGSVDVAPVAHPADKRAKLVAGAWVFEDLPAPEPEPAPPPIEPEPATYPQFASLDYLGLFTEDEQLAVVTATLSSAQVKLWYDRMLAANYITLADPRTITGLNALVTAELLTPARKLEIMAAMDIPSEEQSEEEPDNE